MRAENKKESGQPSAWWVGSRLVIMLLAGFLMGMHVEHIALLGALRKAENLEQQYADAIKRLPDEARRQKESLQSCLSTMSDWTSNCHARCDEYAQEKKVFNGITNWCHGTSDGNLRCVAMGALK